MSVAPVVVMVGSPCIDEYYELNAPPIMGEKTLGTFLGNKVGGMISNAATIVASYGLETALIDTLNHSPSSTRLVDGLRSMNVDSSLISYDDMLADAKCIILLCKGERTILVIKNNKHHLLFNQTQIDAICASKVLYSTICDMAEYDNADAVQQMARKHNVKVVFDVEENTLAPKADSLPFLRESSVLFVNESGVQALLRRYGEKILCSFVEHGTIVVKTLGARGCSVMGPGKDEFLSPAFPVKPVDTTGAGDTFNSSFVYGLLQGWTLERCARFANGAASRAITFMGAQSGACGVKAVNEFIDSFENKSMKS